MNQSIRTCSIDGCSKLVSKRGWCSMHYRRITLYGDPNGGAQRRVRPAQCTVDGCEKVPADRNYCAMHRYRMQHWGALEREPKTEAQRFEEKIIRTAACWLWTGTQNGRGYGFFSINGRYVQAHRYAYESSKGKIPEGLTIDHLCMNKLCVNPDHLEAVTAGENTRRAQIAYGIGIAKTHCPAEHEYTPENTYVEPKGSRSCRTCNVERTRQWRIDNSR